MSFDQMAGCIILFLFGIVLLAGATILVLAFGIDTGIIKTDSGKEKNENRKF